MVRYVYPRWKTTKINWQTIQDMEEVASLHVLTTRQQAILLAFMEQLTWETRWDDLGATQSELNALAADLGNTIMADYELDCADVENCLETSTIILNLQAEIDALEIELQELQDEPTDGNIYPDGPTLQTTPACGAAWYIVAQFRLWISDFENFLDTEPTVFDAIDAIFALDPHKLGDVVGDLIRDLFGNFTSALTVFDANAESMRQYLHCFSNDKAAFRAWLTDNGLDNIGDFLDCLTQSTWDRWVFLGSYDISQDCGGYCDPLPLCLDNFIGVANGYEVELGSAGTAIVPAAIDADFGNNAPSYRAAFIQSGSNYGRDLSVYLYFSRPATITSAEMQYWYNDNGNTSPTRGIYLFDFEGSTLASNQLTSSGATKQAWVNHSWAGSQNGVWGIRFLIRHLGAAATFTQETASAWLDNICIEGVTFSLPVTVDFDSGYSDYSLVQGTVQAVGNPANALRDSRTCSNCSNRAIVNVNFPTPQTVYNVALDAYNLFTLNEVYVRLYDASNTLLASFGGNVTGVSGGGWLNHSYSMEVSNVSRVQLECANGSGAVSTFLDNRLDNIVIS